MKVLFHILFYYWGKENFSLYGELLGCIEVRYSYIEVPLYFHFIPQNDSYNNYKLFKSIKSTYKLIQIQTMPTLIINNI